MTAVLPRLRSSAIALSALALAVTLVATSLLSGGAAASHSAPGAISWPAPSGAAGPGVAALAAQHPTRMVDAIVQLQAGASPAAAHGLVTLGGGSVVRELPIVNGFAAHLSARAALALAGSQGVRAVSLDHPVAGQGKPEKAAPDANALGTAYDQSIRAEKVWKSGITGQNATVAVVDTGVAGGLPDFRVSATDPRSRVSAVATVNPSAPNAQDSFGHGTHIAGIIAGNGANRSAGDPLAGKYIGVAPDAHLVAVKADDGQGHTSELDLIDALQFVVSHSQELGIKVVNLSVRSTVAESYKTDPLDAAVEAVWNHGITVVAAAGNSGTADDAVSYAPANDPYVITVGGVDDQGTKDTSDDVLASWSSRGVTQDGVAKPDVVAPGSHIVAPLAPGAEYASMCPTCVVDGQYLRIGGTSMAAAVVSGAVADIVSANPGWSPDQIKAALVTRSRAIAKVDGTPSTVGEVALDKVLLNNAKPPAPANQGLTPSQWIDPKTGDIELQAGSWSAGSWSAGSWSAGSWSAGSWSAGSWSAATGDYAPSWAAASYTGAPLSPDGWSPTPATCAELARASWTRASWTAGSWSAEGLDAAHAACDQAAAQAGSWSAGSWSAGSWSAGSWSAGSWSAGSWSAGSWSTSFDK